MIERPIVKDIREYEAAQIGPFTWRQVISIVIAAILGVPTYYYGRYYLPKDVCGMLTFALVLIPLACGFVKMYGMTFEKFAWIYIKNNILSTTIRKYKTENTFKYQEVRKSKKKKVEKKKIKKEETNEKNKEKTEE